MTDYPGGSSPEELLIEERANTLQRIASLTRDREGILESTVGQGTDDEHDPEGATIAFERAQIEALLDQSRRHLSDLDRALRRIEDGEYGVCERCGRPIAPERLAARPTARNCVTCTPIS
jgi:RNA polymerase-binding protein DksA